MKKTLFALMSLAVAAVACNKAEVLESNPGQAITFGEAFVDNATKADYSSGLSLEKFSVWGTVTGNSNTVNLYNGAEVTGKVGNAVWNCTQTEYWVPSCSYEFVAIADATSVTAPNDKANMPTEIKYTVDTDKDKDLLLATKTATTNADGTPSENPVKFTFSHLLSKVYFTFTNGVRATNDNYTFEVTGVSISNLTKNGVYTVSGGSWEADGTDVTSLDFGTGKEKVTTTATTSTLSHQILPLTETADITITYNVIYKGTTIMVGETKSATLTDQAFIKNTVYNINVTLPAPGAEIQFSVESVGAFGETEVELQK